MTRVIGKTLMFTVPGRGLEILSLPGRVWDGPGAFTDSGESRHWCNVCTVTPVTLEREWLVTGLRRWPATRCFCCQRRLAWRHGDSEPKWAKEAELAGLFPVRSVADGGVYAWFPDNALWALERSMR